MAKLIDRHIASQVLFLGVSKKTKGGMTSVLVSYDRHIDGMRFIPTWRLGPKAVKAFYMLQAMVRTALLLLLDRRIRIVHIHGAANASFSRCRIFARLSRAFGKKVIIHEHAADFREYYDSSSDKKAIEKTLAGADFIIALSESWKHYFISIGADPQKIAVLNNPVEAETASPRAKNAHTPLRVLFLGEISSRKGAFDLISALAANKDQFRGKVEVRLAGNPVDGDIQAVIADCGLEDTATYLGWVAGEKKRKCLDWADVMILPSYNEGLPISILEAMANGMPVIATTVGGIPEVIADKQNGLLIAPGRPDEIAGALRYYTDNPDKIAIHGAEAKRTVSDFYPEKVFASLTEIYKRLL